MASSDPKHMVVLQSFVGNVDGADLIFPAGESIPADHKAVKKWPHLFGPMPDTVSRYDAPVEKATAAPGEKRGK
jgi:hypothetical protein